MTTKSFGIQHWSWNLLSAFIDRMKNYFWVSIAITSFKYTPFSLKILTESLSSDIESLIPEIFSERFQLCQYFFWTRKDPNTIKSWPILAHQQHYRLNARLKVLLFFRGTQTILLRNPIYFSFSRGLQTPCPPVPLPPVWIPTCIGFRTCNVYSKPFTCRVNHHALHGRIQREE